MKFELLSGQHRTVGGKKYLKGDIVTSDSDLSRRFLNKFARRKDLEGPGAVQPAPVAKTPPSGPKNTVEDDDGNQVQTDAVPPQEPASTLGEDVTSDWPDADGLGVKVFQDGAKYNVAEIGEEQTALNPKPLTKAQAVAFLKRLKK